MSNSKTRPANNFHCFEGVGRPYWRAVAAGQTPTGVRQGPMGSSIDLKVDDDGFVLQNGGMVTPQEAKMMPGRYFRFFGTVAHNRFGAGSALAGGWWLDFENALKVVDWAERFDMSVAQAAQRLLVIPKEWHDCGYLGAATLTTSMKVWLGKGKPATGSVSPHNATRRDRGIAVQTAPALLEVKQLFVPGERALLSRFFKPEQSVSVIHKGTRLPWFA